MHAGFEEEPRITRASRFFVWKRVLSIHQLQRMAVVSAAVCYETWMAIARSNVNPQTICESGLVVTN